MLVGSCHCGAVTIELPSAPEKATSCNCSLCRRLGGPLKPEPGARHGVNLRNFDPKILESVKIRRFDGADTWQFLD